MTRRSTDQLRRQIEERERMLADCRRDGGDGLVIFLERELTRLRADLAHEERPELYGRRATDRAADIPDDAPKPSILR